MPVAPDRLAQAISKKANIDFGKAKIYFDCVVVALSIAILILNNKGLDGLGIGTIVAAFTMGKMVSITGSWIDQRVTFVSALSKQTI